jgi:hypothetical protein
MGVYQSMHRLSDRDETDARAARTVLANHVPDPESGLCAVCLEPAPCRPANAAANRLVELGRPVLPDDPPPTRPAGWRSRWFPHRRGRYRTAPLLTHVWRLRFGGSVARPPAFAWFAA